MIVEDIAEKFFQDLDEPDDLSLITLAFWIRNSVGLLNEMLLTSYTINQNTLEIVDKDGIEISEDAVGVYFQLYLVHYYDKQYRSNLITMNGSMVVSVKDNQRTITMLNRNEVGKTILQAKNSAEETLKRAITGFRMKATVPRQVIGDDTWLQNTLPPLN